MRGLLCYAVAVKNEPLARYAELVGPRTVAIYRVGAAQGALRMLVITNRIGLDNPYYYSVRERLPQRFAEQFAAEPLVIPGWSVRAMQHWRRPELHLVQGHDVARSLAPMENENESLCQALEAYCEGGMLTPELERIFPDLDQAAARQLLHGDCGRDGLHREYAFERTRLIEGYFHDLASMGFGYGALFPAQAYPNAVHAAESVSFLHSVVRNFYQVRRRIEELVA